MTGQGRAGAYLDNAATTPVLPEVVAAMVAAMAADGPFANPSSVHRWGLAAARAVATGRGRIAAALGAAEDEITFTSGGTEANTLAIMGTARARARRGRHVVTTAVEHSSVLAACAALEAEGFAVTRLAVGPDGRVDPGAVAAAIRDDTILCTLAHVNGEIGTIQPIAAIAAALGGRGGVVLHVDGVQALGKVPTPYGAWGVDLASVSGHKIGGPKGIGALYCRDGVRLVPPVPGGAQENGLRPGTENVPGIVGFGVAATLIPRWSPGLFGLKARLLADLTRALPDLRCNGPDPADPQRAAPHIVNISFSLARPLPAEVLLHALEAEGIACSAGSACSARQRAPSHVLAALGLPPDRRDGALRLSLGPSTTAEEIDFAAAHVPDAIVAVAGAVR